ncbi:hypothetical protein MMC26_005357 [Xylographa opegraphella]|nr:hypothetical protein [Xylographa opegraphella]
MHLPQQSRALERRQSPPGPNNEMVWIGLGIAAAVLILIITVLYQINRLRRNHASPRFVPTQYLKSKWRSFEPVSRDDENIYDPANSTILTATSTSYAPSTEVSTSSNAEVDRRVSVRSIMTLPPYRYTPNQDERLIAREGERAGVDTVVEYPESEDEVEARREEEMQALFEIRQARRREAAEREERRQQRREAREQGDWARLRQLEQESRARARARSNASVLTPGSAATSLTNINAGLQSDSAFLIAELASQREAASSKRRVSEVSYADLGLARHDGTRIRADSVESDHRPLLDSAASMGGSRNLSRQSSPGRWAGIRAGHGRNTSDASALSIVTVDSDFADGANTPRTAATRSGSDENAPSHFQLTPQSTIDLADIPSTEPPGYEDQHASPTGEEAPPYESPILARGQGFPGMNALPPSRMERAQASRAQVPTSTAPATNPAANAHSAPRDPSSSRGRERGLPQLRLLPSIRRLPAIEVLSATPVSSVPGTPLEGSAEYRP